nr:MAG TPA: hypothetical protein [Caudoviricetes sp.]
MGRSRILSLRNTAVRFFFRRNCFYCRNCYSW